MVEILLRVAQAGTNVVVVTDDSYFGLFYEDDVLKESLFAKLCNLHPKLLAIKLDGGTKENFIWGLRVGFITYGTKLNAGHDMVFDALEKKTAGCVRGNISNASHLSQSILIKSMTSDRYFQEKKEKSEILKRRAKRVKTVLSDPKYRDAWDVYPFNSGYFMCIRLKSIDAESLRTHLLEKYGVGLIAMGDRDLRVAFSCLEEDDIPHLFDTVLQGVNDFDR
jgi:aspartate/methionine/tyrosine aminotransferase